MARRRGESLGLVVAVLPANPSTTRHWSDVDVLKNYWVLFEGGIEGPLFGAELVAASGPLE